MRASRISLTLLSALLAAVGSAWPCSAEGLETSLKPLVDEIVAGCERAGAKRITIADFTDLQGDVTELGRFVAEELEVSLVLAKPKFGLIDRANLRTILAEHKLNMSGLVNPDTAKKLGQLAGVDGIVTATITPLGDSVRLTVKVIATDTATIMAASRTDVARTKAVEELLRKSGPQAETAITKTVELSRTPEASIPPATVAVTDEVGEFRFQSRGCRGGAGDRVTCFVTITSTANKGKQINVCSSYLLDSLGNKSQSPSISIGGGNRCGDTLEPGLPVTISISADDVVREAPTVSIVLRDESWGSFRGSATLRNIPVQRQR